MAWTSTRVTYRQTGYFSKIITDYLDRAEGLAPFYAHPVSLEGIRSAIQARERCPLNREVLVRVLKEQYAGVCPSPAVQEQLDRLLEEKTFTVCTAHQPALFTGPLYFLYKILHTIRLARHLSDQLGPYHFVPVFYMGSEDADLEELGNFFMGQEQIVWEAGQTGAVGRMKPSGLEKILDRIEGEFSVQPFGEELVAILRKAYGESPDIQTATFRLLHHLFHEYGLVILIADDARLKKLMIPVFEDDLFREEPSKLVGQTIGHLSEQYKVQANPRPINLFYLEGDLRGRIERVGERFRIHESNLSFSEEELRSELHTHPQRFSPNVILRGLYQEKILPNLAFIGGGGETAYWLEYKSLFDHYKVPFPLLIVRNSFLLVEGAWKEKIEKTGLTAADLFRPEEELINEWVRKESRQQLSLDKEIAEAQQFYERIKALARSVDPTLVQHVEALQAKAVDPLRELEKKLFKAEKRKFREREGQIHALYAALFPQGGLQERIANFMPWYAERGKQFITDLYEHSLALEQEFVILEEV
jgi:bacillithiol biosynthesis cysteine-adding enzyme BshC